MRAPLMRLSAVTAVAIMFQVLSAVDRANAWEDDVHYGLTKWLAIKAGFSETEADEIAKADQKVDRSWFTGPMHTTIASACIGSDDLGSRSVHDNHFASQADVPKDPPDRVVIPNRVWLRGAPLTIPTPSARTSRLSLGADLHVLQDTWSHQGQPDVPFACKPMLAWGHAAARGGWSCHLADLTYRWVNEDVLPMAEQTYNILKEVSGSKSAVNWTDIQDDVAGFARLQTKWDKDKWFAAHGFADRSFIEYTSLPDCIGGNCTLYQYRAIFELWNETVANHVQVVNVPPQISEFFNRFLQVMTRVPPPSLATLSEYVDLAGGVRALQSTLNLETPCPKLYGLLSSWMIGKQFVEGRGGETPIALCEAAQKIRETGSQPLSCDQAVDLVSKMIGEAQPRAPVPVEQIPFLSVAVPGIQPETYVGFARFRHLPNDVLVMIADARPRITAFAWIPMR
jgi:hypothetical protein